MGRRGRRADKCNGARLTVDAAAFFLATGSPYMMPGSWLGLDPVLVALYPTELVPFMSPSSKNVTSLFSAPAGVVPSRSARWSFATPPVFLFELRDVVRRAMTSSAGYGW